MSFPTGRPWAGRLLLWFLGGWVFLTVVLGYVAGSNFRVLDPDRLRNADAVYGGFETPEERRLALRYAASELNRHYFVHFTLVQVGLGAVSLALLVLSGEAGPWRATALSGALLVSGFFATSLTPEIVERGRAIDFVAREPEPPPEVDTFYRLHALYLGLDGAKLLLLAGLTVSLVRSGPGASGRPLATGIVSALPDPSSSDVPDDPSSDDES